MPASKSGAMSASLTTPSGNRSNTREEIAVMNAMAEAIAFPQILGGNQRKI